MPNAYGRAFTTANFLPNLAALKAINFGASDPLGCWFVVPNSTTNNIEIWVWDPASTATTNEIDVIRPDSVASGTPGRCIQRLKFDASQLAGFLGALAQLSTTGIVERTSGGGAIANAISAFGKTLLNLADAAAARAALVLGNVATRNIGTTSGTVRDAADSAYTNSRTPTSHASTHAAGGADEIPIYGYLAVSGNTTLNATHERLLIDVNATSSAITITLPSASTVGAGWLLKVRKNDASVNAVTISRSGSDTINGATLLQITSRYQTIVLLSFGGTSWGVVGAFDDYVRRNPDQTIAGVKTFSGGLVLPNSAGSSIGSLWRNTDNLEYRDSASTIRTVLNSRGNLSNLENRQTALNNLAGAVASGQYLRGDGANIVLSPIQITDVPTLNQNTTGTASNVTGIVGIANGGTGSNTQNFVDLTSAQNIAGLKTFATGIRVGGAIGNIRLTPASAVNAGYMEVYAGNSTTRLGYIGFDNTNLNYQSEGSAVHAFNGNRVDVFGGTIPSTNASRVSLFLNSTNAYFSLISSTAPVNYKAYDLANENGAFSIRRITDGYGGVSGNLFRYTSTNTLTLGDSNTKSSSSFGSISIAGKLGGYAGIYFPDGFDTPTIMLADNSRFSGVWSPNAAGGFHWYYASGNFNVLGGDGASEGTYIGLNKGLGSLPGFATNRYPTLKTDFSLLYLSAGGAFSAQIATNGTYTAVSDKNKKTVVEPIDPLQTLNKIEKLPVNRFFFNDEDERITHIGTFAQDFHKEFECGGNQEIIDDDSPISPDKMLATSDVAGVCLSGIQGLIIENTALKKRLQKLEDTF